ncbi:hypothetical protein OGAPHI_004172 [Ogataea philodendri]|uniref:3-oxo-5-alpha-steroid 4-dehydrogenase C-terminal domain-containing protein n=1 Tax=Ogataea philodendri TaxID=1378263 RepID=A0A9P8P5P8_9ASCO|nr:uncharacterized protein OGAPHI_004172 [Ogataea philodendri]KAH3665983.1 hypothetical protein OGAPHI_004172 [Ogataea philodendri]
MVNLIIVPRSKNLRKINCDTDPRTKVQAIINEYSNVNKINPNRVRISVVEDEESKDKKSVRKTLKNEKTLEANGLDFSKTDTITVYAKDVGPQIDWRTVYLIEYFGPILIHSLVYFLLYNPEFNTPTQVASYVLSTLHYLKREYETTFIHMFSADTMPLKYLFRNSGHYWIFNGLFIALCVYAPQRYYTGIQKYIFHVEDRTLDELYVFAGLWATCELANFYCHYLLMKLRSDGSREKRIPYGFFFSLVSFPNYFFESLGWLIYAIMNNNWSSYLFFIIGTGTMMVWAKQKHRNYKKTFGDDYPKNRKAMIPFIF